MKQQILSLLNYLNNCERLSSDKLIELQNQKLKRIVEHHAKHTPHFQVRLKRDKLQSISTQEELKKLQTIKKKDIQWAGAGFLSNHVPKEHLPIGEAKTSGSTGEPVTIQKTFFNQLYWHATNLRDHKWYNRKFDGKLASIRANFKEVQRSSNWGGPVPIVAQSGPAMGIPVTMDIKEQLELLNDFQPNYMIVHAGVLNGFVSEWERNGYTLKELKHLKNVGDTVHPELRQRVKEVTGLSIEDSYSSSEVGTISIQCPMSGLYHIMSENLIVEILNPDGSDTEEGQVGSVVVTDLYNTASPIIRYDLGDYARVGPKCSCGRNLPTLSEIIGRERNLFVRPDGSKFWPRAGFMELEKVTKVHQWQIIQHSIDRLEYKLVTDNPITEEQKSQFRSIFARTLTWNGSIDVTWVQGRIQPNPGGKFEESICLIKS